MTAAGKGISRVLPPLTRTPRNPQSGSRWRTHSVAAGPVVFSGARDYANQPKAAFLPIEQVLRMRINDKKASPREKAGSRARVTERCGNRSGSTTAANPATRRSSCRM